MAGLIKKEVKTDLEVNTLDFESNMDTYLDNLFDSSSVVKSNALEKWIDHFVNNYFYDINLESNAMMAEQLVDSCMKGISRMENVELCCDFLILIAVTMGDDGQQFGRCVESLLVLYENPETSVLLKAKYLKTIGVLSFIWRSEDAENTMENLKLFNQVINDYGYESSLDEEQNLILLTALHLWALMATIVDDDDLLSFLVEDPILPSIGAAVTNGDYAIKAAAGKTLGYVANLLEEHMNDRDISHYDYEFEGETVLEDLRLAKKPKKYQGLSTVQIAECIEFGDPIAVDIVIHHKTYSFTTWLDINRLDIFRSVLKAGFQTHLKSNVLLGDVLGVEIEAPVKLGKDYKNNLAGYYDAKNKNRQISRKHNRSIKQASLLS